MRRSDRPVVELCHQLRLTPAMLAASTGEGRRRRVTLRDPDTGEVFTLLAEGTPQHYGGLRWWWCCPTCGARRLALLSSDRNVPFACRRCLRAVYLRGRPSAEPLIVYKQLMGWLPGPFEVWEEIVRLSGPRRRGVRRGRRVAERAQRLLAKAPPLDSFLARHELRRGK